MMRRITFISILGLLFFFSLYNYYTEQQLALQKPVITVIKSTPYPHATPWAISSISPEDFSKPVANVSNSIITSPTPSATPTPKPIIKPTVKPTPTPAPKVAFSEYYPQNGSPVTLYNSGGTRSWPIASITKLMTALVVKKYFPNDAEIPISNDAVDIPAVAGNLKVGEIFKRDELLYPLLIESSNDAAYAFAERVGVTPFVSLMNQEAENLGMTHTHFVNVSGLDTDGGNISTARDLAILARYLVKNYPDILQITRLSEYTLKASQGDYEQKLKTTNYALTDSRISLSIIGGKTGETDLAMQNLLLITEAPNHDGFIVSIVMGSVSRFDDMVKTIDKALIAHTW